MRRYFILSLIFLLCMSSTAIAQHEGGYIIQADVTDERLIYVSDKNVISREFGIYTVESQDELDNFCDSYNVEKYQPDYKVELFDVPNDKYYSQRWDASALNLPDMWDYDINCDNVNVAIIDTGITSEHKDFDYNAIECIYNVCAARKILSSGGNPDSEENFSVTHDVEDDIGHGTNVAGIIAAIRNNKNGTFGISNNVKLKIYKAFSTDCDNASCIISALMHIYENQPDIDVINLSIGFQNGDIVQDVINKLAERGVIIVAAVGNSGTDTVNYPAGCDNVIGAGSVSACHNHDNCIDVCSCSSQIGTATLSDLKVSSFSQHNNSVDVVAPGWKLVTTNTDNSYSNVKGTSFSSPYVAGVAAIVKSINKNIGHDEFLELLKQTSLDKGDEGYDTYYGNGIIQPSVIADVLADKYGTLLLSQDDVILASTENTITVKCRNRDYKIYAVNYNENGEISNVQNYTIYSGNGEYTLNLTTAPDKIFCWDFHMQPLFKTDSNLSNQ